MQSDTGLIVAIITSCLSALVTILLGVKFAIKSNCCTCRESPLRNENKP